jgi:hypothetical protein
MSFRRHCVYGRYVKEYYYCSLLYEVYNGMLVGLLKRVRELEMDVGLSSVIELRECYLLEWCYLDRGLP